ncbi:MAG: EutN/CcmL family microcompartment protein [Actinomycetota bacterium]
MEIAKIIGTVVSTIKVSKIENTRLKIAQVVDPYGRESENYYLVEDAIGVGAGETVLLADDGDTVSRIVGRENVPIRASVVAKIDNIDMYE